MPTIKAYQNSHARLKSASKVEQMCAASNPAQARSRRALFSASDR